MSGYREGRETDRVEILNYIVKKPIMRSVLQHRDVLEDTAVVKVLVTIDLFIKTSPGLTDEVLPLGVQISLVGQAALHDVGTVAGAGFDGGQAATVGAVDQLHQGLRALWAERNLGRRTAGVRETQKIAHQSRIFLNRSRIFCRGTVQTLFHEKRSEQCWIFLGSA